MKQCVKSQILTGEHFCWILYSPRSVGKLKLFSQLCVHRYSSLLLVVRSCICISFAVFSVTLNFHFNVERTLFSRRHRIIWKWLCAIASRATELPCVVRRLGFDRYGNVCQYSVFINLLSLLRVIPISKGFIFLRFFSVYFFFQSLLNRTHNPHCI